MPRLCDVVARLAECIDSIAQVTTDEEAKRQLNGGARTILCGCAQVQASGTVLLGEQHGPGPGTATRPPQLAARDCPQPMTGDLLQAASVNPAPATTATAKPARQATRGIPAAAPGPTEPASSPQR